jgi:hypothetical protein
MYLSGAAIMSYNIWRTIRMPSAQTLAAPTAPVLIAAE